ncbi:hypothetical protein GQX74_008856 [Glossina fuscipes]|nr:hypothetical protein GQX74_008856 [Glossina fuscipes]
MIRLCLLWPLLHYLFVPLLVLLLVLLLPLPLPPLLQLMLPSLFINDDEEKAFKQHQPTAAALIILARKTDGFELASPIRVRPKIARIKLRMPLDSRTRFSLSAGVVRMLIAGKNETDRKGITISDGKIERSACVFQVPAMFTKHETELFLTNPVSIDSIHHMWALHD